MTQRFFIPGLLPNLNDMLAAARKSRGKWNAFNDMKGAHELYIISCIKKANLHAVVRPVEVHFIWSEANKKRDLDNISVAKKFILDALQQAGILSGDGWAQIYGLSDAFLVDKETPGVCVEMEEV